MLLRITQVESRVVTGPSSSTIRRLYLIHAHASFRCPNRRSTNYESIEQSMGFYQRNFLFGL